MDFEIYCDENHPDLFTSAKPRAEYLMIGSLWLPCGIRNEIKQKIWSLRKGHNIWGEIKWSKIGKGSLPFYKSLVDLFESYGEQLRFRCIAVRHREFDSCWHGDDNELGFYKFYYQVLHHWILDFNSYRIFCDIKTNRDLGRLHTLKSCLKCSNISADIKDIQALPSKQVTLIQLSDLLLGIASARINNTLRKDSPKAELVSHLEERMNRKVAPTQRYEHKFNVFKINLQGGW